MLVLVLRLGVGLVFVLRLRLRVGFFDGVNVGDSESVRVRV